MNEAAVSDMFGSAEPALSLPPVQLDQFEGPLDVLLHLIRSQKLEIFDIPIAMITSQYLQILDAQEELDLEVAGDYLVMASTLMQLKSRLLLPRPELDDEGNEIDPRAELAAQLIAYEQYRMLAEDLNERPRISRDVFTRSIFPEADEVERPLPEGDLDALLIEVDNVVEWLVLGAAQDLYRHRRLITEATKIVLFQNGWGNADKFTSFFSGDRIYNARVITGFVRPRPNVVDVTVHADSIHIGSLFGGDLSFIHKLCELISAGDIGCEVTETIEKDLWAKMLYNCALNPLGAILDVPYGRLAESESTRLIMNAVIKEVFAVLAAAAYRTHWQNPADFIEVFYEKLVPDTAEHKSSTLQDILAKKPTEIDALNGAVIELANRHEIAVPYNLAVYNMVKFLEARTN